MNDMPREFREIKFLEMAKVLSLITLSKHQLWRIRNSGDFPEPVKLGDRRKAWRHADVFAWMQEKMNARPYPAIKLRAGDRFINIATVCQLTTISRQHIGRLKAQGVFPPHIRISEGRIVWLEREIEAWILAPRCY
jgi:prophage regulatory protein